MRTNQNKQLCEDSPNIFHKCRIKAAKENKVLSIRINAAEKLNVSESSLKNYETGVTRVVPTDVVIRMSEVYNAPELCRDYCIYIFPLGEKCVQKLDTEQLHLDRLTIKLLNSIKAVAAAKDALIEIAADGEITDDERPQLEEILDTLNNISMNAQELRLWAEKELHIHI